MGLITNHNVVLLLDQGLPGEEEAAVEVLCDLLSLCRRVPVERGVEQDHPCHRHVLAEVDHEEAMR